MVSFFTSSIGTVFGFASPYLYELVFILIKIINHIYIPVCTFLLTVVCIGVILTFYYLYISGDFLKIINLFENLEKNINILLK